MRTPDWEIEGTMARAQRDALLHALTASDYVVANAARQLRIGRSSAYRLIKRFGITVPEDHDPKQARAQRKLSPAPAACEKVTFDGRNYILTKP